MEILVGAILLWIVPIFVTVSIGNAKHRAGFFYGLFLGWIGVLVLAVLPAQEGITLDELERRRAGLSPKYYEKRKAELMSTRIHRECPSCKEDMRRDAEVCPHCRNESKPWTQHEGKWWVQADGTWHVLDEATLTWTKFEQSPAPQT